MFGIDTVVTALQSAIQSSWAWVVQWLCEFYSPFILWIVGLLPDMGGSSFDSAAGVIAPYLYVANQWLPLDYAAGFLAIYVTFAVSFFCVKVVLYLF